ncbi:ABC transporter ATP-binding protein [Paenibacillus puldeungensis]|uniref:ABC transporter ATP-binding protein n=1 Tax=Paenibacillus puldeungensis TaxID=696536 RepID=A0ABW3S0M2_9BACL
MKIKELVEPLRVVKRFVVYTAIAGMGAAGLNLTRPVLLGNIFEGFVKGDSYGSVMLLIILFALSWCATWGLSLLLGYLSTKVKERILARLRTAVLSHLMRLPYAQSEQLPTGKIQAYITSDLPLWSNLYGMILVQIVHSAAQLIGAVVTLLNVNSKLMIILVPFLAISAVIPLIFSRSMIRIHRFAQDAISDTLEKSQCIIHGCRDIISLNIEKWCLKRCTEAFIKSENAEIKRSMAQGTVQVIGAFAENAAYIVVLLIGGWSVFKDSMSVGHLVSFLATIQLIFFPSRNAGDLASAIQSSLAAANRVQEFLSLKPMNEKYTLRTHIEIKNLSYTYPNERKKALDSISCEINQGYFVVILGESGSGKSTLLKIIAGLYEPTEGEMITTGPNIGLPSAVWQDPFLLNASVFDNLALGRDVSERQMKDMAQKLNLDRLIAEMPNQYDTFLLENGRNLSGGQRQRIAIIRSLISSKKCIVIDEPTAGLDMENARKVWDAILDMNKDVTRIVTTHQLDKTHEYADLILVLQEGKLIEYGPPQELLRMNGFFKKLMKR